MQHRSFLLFTGNAASLYDCFKLTTKMPGFWLDALTFSGSRMGLKGLNRPLFLICERIPLSVDLDTAEPLNIPGRSWPNGNGYGCAMNRREGRVTLTGMTVLPAE
ncbi:hypothetical protein [Beijerinckia indica]|uniref:hypothetical protein n=1 Tax=Beijerinckia indica TaxID=533 RepID=UPI0013053BDE|nr:hypothetical protein [Beijerinckia indica]